MKTLFIVLFTLSLLISMTTIASATGNKHKKCCGKIGVPKVQSFYSTKSKAFHRNAVAKSIRPKVHAMPMFRPSNRSKN
jgi:hypothetical protein